MCMVVCDGLKGLPEAIETSGRSRDPDLHRAPDPRQLPLRLQEALGGPRQGLKPIYTAPSEPAALDAFVEFTEEWGDKYPAIIRFWDNAWAEFVPFLQFDTEIRASCAPPTPSNPSTRGSAERSTPAGTFQRGRGAEMRLPGHHEPRSDRSPRPRWSNRWKDA